MLKNSVYDVFTPSKPATLTFVERHSINERLVDSLKTPGKQLVMYGTTGSGKTTIIVNKLCQLYEGHIITRCMSDMSFDQLVLDAFDQLGSFYTLEKTQLIKKGISSSISADYLSIRASISSDRNKEAKEKQHRIIPPQLTAQRLAQFLGSAKHCWVLEDFHKITDKNEKKKLSQAMKVFMDAANDFNEVKIIALGTKGTAREVIEYDEELKNRVAEIHVPLMNELEIAKILAKGEQCLNIKFFREVMKKIAKYSNGLPSVCHQLALNSCVSLGLQETSDSQLTITDKDFYPALERYVEDESDTTKTIFEKALRQDRKKKFYNFRLILSAIAQDESEDGVTRANILARMRALVPTYPPGNLTIYLRQLQTEERGDIIRFDETSGKYSFSNPFHKVFALAYFKTTGREYRWEEAMRRTLMLSDKVSMRTMERIIERIWKES